MQKLALARAQHFTRKRLIAMALSIAMGEEEDDDIFLMYMRRPRVHRFWMLPYLHQRTDASQRNTLAKLEADFVRVSIPFFPVYTSHN